jgi:hypothetical protein
VAPHGAQIRPKKAFGATAHSRRKRQGDSRYHAAYRLVRSNPHRGWRSSGGPWVRARTRAG